MKASARIVQGGSTILGVVLLLHGSFLWGETNVFFSIMQTTNMLAPGLTADTIASDGYLFTVTRDKLFTGGVGLTNPIGRTVRVPWPDGLEAQAVTAGPAPGSAVISIRRGDGQPFAIASFVAKLLANTAGAGASFEIMPKLNGEDPRPDPFAYDATGYAGSRFSYATPELAGFDGYTIALYVDYALTTLTVVDASAPRPELLVARSAEGALELAWPADAPGYVLQFATNLPAATWQSVTNRPATNNDTITVLLPPSGRARYFRLRHD